MKWLKKKEVPFSELEEHPCPNCGHVFKGHFCPNCGQSTHEFDQPFGFIFYDFLGNIVAFDFRLLKTFKYLIIRPGFLTLEFFRGKRATYAPPFRVYIFLSFLLFLLLQIVTSQSLTNVLDYSFKNEDSFIDSVSTADLDSLGVQMDIIDKADSSKTVNFDVDWSMLAKQENLKASLTFMAGHLEERLERTEDEKSRRILLQFIEICRSPDQLVSRILKYLSWAFFILLPVFALLLKFFFIRRKINYTRHLIFSVHLHSFIFLLFTIVIAFNLIFEGQWTIHLIWLLLAVPVYLILSMKYFYRQGVVKTFMKALLVSFIYNMIVVIAFGYVVMNAFSNI